MQPSCQKPWECVTWFFLVHLGNQFPHPTPHVCSSDRGLSSFFSNFLCFTTGLIFLPCGREWHSAYLDFLMTTTLRGDGFPTAPTEFSSSISNSTASTQQDTSSTEPLTDVRYSRKSDISSWILLIPCSSFKMCSTMVLDPPSLFFLVPTTAWFIIHDTSSIYTSTLFCLVFGL